MLGQKSKHAETCLAEGFIGTGFEIQLDLTGRLHDQWREFNKEFIPVYLEAHPDKSRAKTGTQYPIAGRAPSDHGTPIATPSCRSGALAGGTPCFLYRRQWRGFLPRTNAPHCCTLTLASRDLRLC